MTVALALGVITWAALLVIAELGRTFVARAFGATMDRHPMKVMKLPGTRGSSGVRLALIVAGPVTVYLAISAFAFGVFSCYGVVVPGTNRIASLTDGPTGELTVGDRILAIDELSLDTGTEGMARHLDEKGGAPVVLTIERGGERRNITVQPKRSNPGRPGYRWKLGITFDHRVQSTSLAFEHAIRYPFDESISHISNLATFFVDDGPDPNGFDRYAGELESSFRADLAAFVAMFAGVYGLLALALLDLVRALLLLLFRR